MHRSLGSFFETGELPHESGVPGATSCVVLHGEIPPSGQQSFPFLMSWHFLNRTPARGGWQPAPGHASTIIGNAYVRRFVDAARYAATHIESANRKFTPKNG